MRNYRIVRIAGANYQHPVTLFYNKNPELKNAPFAVQQNAFFQKAYVYSDSFSRAMRSLGHEVHEIVGDVEIMQKAWAKENGVEYDPAKWQTDIICAQLRSFKPDVVYLQGLGVLPYQILKGLKKEMPFIKLIVQYTCFPGAFSELKDVDVLFAGTPTMVKQFKGYGLNPYLLYHSFDDNILNKIDIELDGSNKVAYDFIFAGTAVYGYCKGHHTRYSMLLQLIGKTNIELWINDLWVDKPTLIKDLKTPADYAKAFIIKLLQFVNTGTLKKISGSKALPPWQISRRASQVINSVIANKELLNNSDFFLKALTDMFPERCHKPVFGIDMYRLLHETKIVFNRHTDEAIDSVGNMRMFEATGVGTCLLTDTGRNMPDLFDEGSEVVTYSGIDECIDKAKYLLLHEDVRRGIAEAGQKRTLKDHTTLNRCRQVDEVLQQKL